MARAGEDALIARYFAPLSGPGAEGLRDDAASLTPSPGHDLVVTADAVVAGVHYFPDDPPGSIAIKALGVNLSDLAAKGASPRGFLLTLALPDDWTEAWLSAFAEGLGTASRHHACPLLGGDTVRSGGPALIGITALGEVPAGCMVRRQTARAGDRLCVSGSIGDAALGLALRLSTVTTPDAVALDALRDRYLHPRPRLSLAPLLRRHARAAMDVSDGLVGDLTKMLAGTGLTAQIEAARVPLSSAARAVIGGDAGRLTIALTGGDDYEILCAVPPERLAAFLDEADQAGVRATEIGSVEPGEAPPRVLDASGAAMTFTAESFSHF